DTISAGMTDIARPLSGCTELRDQLMHLSMTLADDPSISYRQRGPAALTGNRTKAAMPTLVALPIG
ncbi:MAG TPA: hypothetical protein VGO22_14845, partial [Pseudorhizobium sp.]|nr:hypothetical protein [Pseudorhizobium sp.]